MKSFLKSLFSASSKEITGFLALIILLVISFIIPGVIKKLTVEDKSHWVEDEKLLDSLVVLLEKEQSSREISSRASIKLYYFNPNKVTYDEMVSLGFSEKIGHRIINYREKGGVFRVKDDLYKIYDIDSSLVAKLYEFIELPLKEARAEPIKEAEPKTSSQLRIAPKANTIELPDFDINEADTATLKTIKGIGSVLSKRIIIFRNNLGGFTNDSQLYEVYNLDSAVVLKLLSKAYIDINFIPVKLLINHITEEELARHPYISWQQARLIIAYRNQHGDYKSGQDLLNVYGIDENDVNRIISYLDWTPSN